MSTEPNVLPYAAPPSAGPVNRTRGIAYAYLAACFGSGAHLINAGSIGALYVTSLGGSGTSAMLVGSIPVLIQVLQLPTAILVPPARARRFMHWCYFLSSPLMAAAYLSPLVLHSDHAVPTVLALLTAAWAVAALAGTFWFPMLHDLVPGERRGRFFGWLRACWSVFGFLVVWVAGEYLGGQPSMWQYQAVFAACVILTLTRSVFVLGIPTGESFHAESAHDDWREYVRQVVRERSLMKFCAYYTVFGFCSSLFIRPLVLYMEHLNFPVSENVGVLNLNMLGNTAAFLVASAIVDRVGPRRILAVAHVLMCVAAGAIVVVTFQLPAGGRRLLQAAMIASGAVLALASVACTAELFARIPRRGRSFLMSLTMMLTAWGVSAAPLLFGALIDVLGHDRRFGLAGRTLDVYQVLLMAGLVLLTASLGLLKWVRGAPGDPPTPG